MESNGAKLSTFHALDLNFPSTFNFPPLNFPFIRFELDLQILIGIPIYIKVEKIFFLRLKYF